MPKTHECPKCRRAEMTPDEWQNHKCTKQPKRIIVREDGSWIPVKDSPAPPAYALTEADKDCASWMVNAGIDDMQSRLKDMTGTARDIAVLDLALVLEKKGGSPRSSRLKPMEAALKRYRTALAPALQLVGESKLPDWSRARYLAEGIKLHVRIGLAGQILLGHELEALKLELGFAGRGGDRRSNPHDGVLKSTLLRTWDQWCKAEIGISDNTADRLIETYRGAKARLKRLGGDKHMLALLDKPVAKLDEEARNTLAALVNKCEWGDSQKALLEEWHIFKKAAVSAGGDTSGGKPKKIAVPVEQLAFGFFHKAADSVAKVGKVIENLRLSSDYKGYLAALPLTTEEPNKPSLTTLEAALESLLSGDAAKALAEIKAMIAAKRSSAIKAVA